jgi:hypothetical protein
LALMQHANFRVQDWVAVGRDEPAGCDPPSAVLISCNPLTSDSTTAI